MEFVAFQRLGWAAGSYFAVLAILRQRIQSLLLYLTSSWVGGSTPMNYFNPAEFTVSLLRLDKLPSSYPIVWKCCPDGNLGNLQFGFTPWSRLSRRQRGHEEGVGRPELRDSVEMLPGW